MSEVLVANMQVCSQSKCGRAYREKPEHAQEQKKICPDCKRLIKLGLEKEE